MPPRLQPTGDIERASLRPSEDQVKMFVQGRISKPINDSKLIFHMRMHLYDGWMDELGFYVPSTVFQSFRDDGRVNMKGSVQ